MKHHPPVVPLTGPSEELLHNLRQQYVLRRTPALPGASNEIISQLYELQLSRPLPTVNVSNTLATRCLSKDNYLRLLSFMRTRFHLCSLLYRVLSLGFLGILVIPNTDVRTALALAYMASCFTLFVVIAFLSLEVIALLVRNYEFWFMSIINVVQFVALSSIFGDVRSLSCIVTWLSVQTIVLIDANYRTFPAAARSVVIGIPSIAAIGACCALDFIAGAKHIMVFVSGVPVVANDIVLFTTSTLVLFLVKKVYYKHIRRHITPFGFHEVPCVVLRARLRLVPTHERQRRNGVSVSEAAETSRIRKHTALHKMQKIRLSKAPIFIVDAARTLIPNAIDSLLYTCPHYSHWAIAILYSVGFLGVATSVATSQIIYWYAYRSDLILAVSATSTLSTLLFTSTFACMWQRDVMISLIFNFDFMFSMFQIYALAVCQCFMVRWRLYLCLPVITWWLWFQWILLLDALTPLARERLRFQKRFATGIMVLLLLSALAAAVAMFFSPNEDIIQNRVLWSIDFGHRPFEMRASTFAIQRVASIIGWSTRLAFELARGHEDEMLFIQGLIEYESPFETFPVQTSSQRRATSSIMPSLRRH